MGQHGGGGGDGGAAGSKVVQWAQCGSRMHPCGQGGGGNLAAGKSPWIGCPFYAMPAISNGYWINTQKIRLYFSSRSARSQILFFKRLATDYPLFYLENNN